MPEVLTCPDPLLARLSAQVPGMMYAFVREADGRMHMPYVSDAVHRLYGLAPDTVRQDARPLLQRVHPQDLPLLSQRMQHSVRTGAHWQARFRARIGDGPWCWHEGRSQVARQADGSAVWYGYIDEACGREAQQQLAQQLRALQAAHHGLAGSLQRLAHELATPLAAVMGLVQLLLRRAELLSDMIRDRLERVLGAGQHMQALLHELHDLSALEGGRLDLRSEPLDLAHAARQACQLMEAVATARQIQLHLQLQADDAPAPRVQADPLRLRQVLLNLLGNALKFTPPGGQVSVRVSASAGTARIEVDDSGPGMDAAQQSELFVPFARLGAEKLGIAGSGLGLALSRALMEAMDGHISVRSAPGEGTCVTVALPLAPAAAAAPADAVPTP